MCGAFHHKPLSSASQTGALYVSSGYTNSKPGMLLSVPLHCCQMSRAVVCQGIDGKPRHLWEALDFRASVLLRK